MDCCCTGTLNRESISMFLRRFRLWYITFLVSIVLYQEWWFNYKSDGNDT